MEVKFLKTITLHVSVFDEEGSKVDERDETFKKDETFDAESWDEEEEEGKVFYPGLCEQARRL